MNQAFVSMRSVSKTYRSDRATVGALREVSLEIEKGGFVRLSGPSGSGKSTLLNLVLMRASQINGCAYCLDMHSKDARADGETEQRLYGLEAWRETPVTTLVLGTAQLEALQILAELVL